jgi:hypothetical protein
MSVFQEILDLARQQSQALERGDLEDAVRLISVRAPLVEQAGRAGHEDAEVIHEILRLDRQLSSAIRERMVDIRNQACKTQYGRTALAGYEVKSGSTAHLLDGAG